MQGRQALFSFPPLGTIPQKGEAAVSDATRLAQFLAKRLGEMGIEVRYVDGDRSAQGELSLSSTPFPTLDEPLVLATARFYTLGHNRLKFFSPGPLFDLAAIDVARCTTRDDVEAALRKAWNAQVLELRAAAAWLRELGAEHRFAARGTRLLLPQSGERSPPSFVRSRTELLVPSGGALAHVSLAGPAERRHRPLRSLELATELELGLEHEMSRLAQRNSKGRPAARVAQPSSGLVHVPRVLALDDNADALAALAAVLQAQGYEVAAFRDPQRALASFHEHSYDLVVAEARMRRIDGLEFTARLQELAGVERLPVVLFDERANSATGRAAKSAGASAYIAKPAAWWDAGETFADLIDGVDWRRFVRYPARLSVQPVRERSGPPEVTLEIARGGLSLRTARELQPGSVERFRISLPLPHSPVTVDAAVVCGLSQSGEATVVAGLRFLRFLGGGEARWIRLIEDLAQRAAGRRRG